MKHRIITCSLIGTLLLLTGCSNNHESRNDSLINVEVEKIKHTDGSEAFSYSGTIEESEITPLSFSGIGTVARVLVSEGDFVKKGQLLATLNDETYKNTYEISLASLKQAEDAYKRLQPMYKNGNLPEIKIIEVETGLQQAKAAAAIAKKSLNDCKLYSPIDGVVGKRSIDPGMSALPNIASINIVKINKVFARISVSENEIAMIKKGQKAVINIGALNCEEYIGTIEEIGVLADPIGHTYKIKISIDNKEQKIKPGMICNVMLYKSGDNLNLFVPSRAVLVDEQGVKYVYIVYNNKATRKNVKVGRLLKNGVEIMEGLSNGDKVITAGMQKLVENSSVHIINQ